MGDTMGLGTMFLANYMTAFDYNLKQIGLAVNPLNAFKQTFDGTVTNPYGSTSTELTNTEYNWAGEITIGNP
jgi:hypothetical protein